VREVLRKRREQDIQQRPRFLVGCDPHEFVGYHIKPVLMQPDILIYVGFNKSFTARVPELQDIFVASCFPFPTDRIIFRIVFNLAASSFTDLVTSV
jgi:hypothetical protein